MTASTRGPARRPGHPPRAALALLFLAALPGARAADPLHDLWSALSRNQSTAAREALERIPADQRGTRPVRLAEGTALLTRQPKTTANVARAVARFEELRAENPDDEEGRAARYLIARAVTLHVAPGGTPDRARAAELLTELARQHPASFHGQLAVVKLLPLRLEGIDDPAAVATVLDEVAALGAAVTVPEVRRNLLFGLASVALWFDVRREETAAWLLESVDLGFARRGQEGVSLLRAAATELRLGRREAAAAHYRRFLAEHPRSIQAHEARLLLAALGGEAAP